MTTITFERLWNITIDDEIPTREEFGLLSKDAKLRHQRDMLLILRDLMEGEEEEQQPYPQPPSPLREQMLLKALNQPESIAALTEMAKNSTPITEKDFDEFFGFAPVKPVEHVMEKKPDWMEYIIEPVQGITATAEMVGKIAGQSLLSSQEVTWISPRKEVASGQYIKKVGGCIFRIFWPDGSFDGTEARMFDHIITIQNAQSVIKGIELIEWWKSWNENEVASLQVVNFDTKKLEPWERLPFVEKDMEKS